MLFFGKFALKKLDAVELAVCSDTKLVFAIFAVGEHEEGASRGDYTSSQSWDLTGLPTSNLKSDTLARHQKLPQE